jgi:hypothetical protein
MKVATKKRGTIMFHGDTFRLVGVTVISSLIDSRSGSFSSETFALETMMRLLKERRKQKVGAKEDTKLAT